MRVVAVIANWNGGAQNVECLESLVAAGLAESDIVFVDNGSRDGSAEVVAARFPEVKMIRNATNLGFGEAANQGARVALGEREESAALRSPAPVEGAADAVFFVNNDVVVPPEALRALVDGLEHDASIGIVGPRVLLRQDPSLVWCAGGMLTWRENLSTLLGHLQKDGAAWRTTRDVDYVAGCALLARSTLLRSVGLFDATYFAYMEDVDLCLRAQRTGARVLMRGDVAVLHASSSATGGGYNPRRKYMMGVNSIWFLRRHAGVREWARFVWFDVLSLPFLWIRALFQGRARSVLAKAKGILDGLRGKRVTAESIQDGASWLW